MRVAIVDDHAVVGQGLGSLLAREPDIEVVAVGASLTDATEILAGTSPPDVLLLDVRLGEESGLELLRSAGLERTSVIVLTAYDQAPYLEAAHRLGAAGFVVKSAPLATLLDAIRRVAAGETAFDRIPGSVVSLTPRERSVLALLLGGKTNDEIGSALGITTRTVEAHLARLFERADVGSRTELATRALREGWLDVPPTISGRPG